MEPDCDPTGLASGSSDDNVLRERRDSSRHRLHTYCCNTIGTKRLRGSRSRSTSGADRLRQMISDRRPVEKCKPCPESSSTTSADSPSNTVYCYQTDTGCTGLGDAGRHVESIEEMEDSFHKTMQELDDMNEEFVSSGNRNQGQDNHEVIDLEGMDAEGLKPESLGPRFKEADDGGPAAGPSLSKAKSKDRHKAGPSQASTTNRKACKALPSTKSVHSRKSKTECPSKRTSRAPSRVPSRAFNKSAECATTRSGLGLYRSTERSRPDNCRSGEWPPDRHRRIFQQSELLSSSKCTTAGRRLLPSTTRDCDDEDDIFDNTAVAHKTDACATRKLRFSDDSVNKRC